MSGFNLFEMEEHLATAFPPGDAVTWASMPWADLRRLMQAAYDAGACQLCMPARDPLTSLLFDGCLARLPNGASFVKVRGLIPISDEECAREVRNLLEEVGVYTLPAESPVR